MNIKIKVSNLFLMCFYFHNFFQKRLGGWGKAEKNQFYTLNNRNVQENTFQKFFRKFYAKIF